MLMANRCNSSVRTTDTMLTVATLGMFAYGAYSLPGRGRPHRGAQLELGGLGNRRVDRAPRLIAPSRSPVRSRVAPLAFGLLRDRSGSALGPRARMPGGVGVVAIGAMLGLQALAVYRAAELQSGLGPRDDASDRWQPS